MSTFPSHHQGNGHPEASINSPMQHRDVVFQCRALEATIQFQYSQTTAHVITQTQVAIDKQVDLLIKKLMFA